MSQDKAASSRMWFGELFQVGVYKRSQGRISRQVTFAAMAIVFALGAWRFYGAFSASLSGAYGLIISVAILLAGLWLGFRVVNIPRFADFLIAVEAEMNKVSWPSRPELVRSSLVVIFVIFSLSLVLFGFDLLWSFLFQAIGVLRQG